MDNYFGNDFLGLNTTALAFHESIFMLFGTYPGSYYVLRLNVAHHQRILEAEDGRTTTMLWELPAKR